ncbi:hypothetical protein P8452_40551 [Trifolium repens]|nr:hypothetical protein P8452_40551 [Trifolium repens]
MKHKFVEDKFVDDDFIVFNFKENGVKDDKGVHIYARPSFLKGEEEEGKQRTSLESRGSVESEDSTDSFSFPVLDWEWIGSPVRMPKPEGQQRLKQKAGCVRFRL